MVNIKELGAYPPSPSDYQEQYRLAGHEWVDLNSAAKTLEDAKEEIFNKMVMDLMKAAELNNGKLAFNRAEAEVKISSEWITYKTEMREARTKADHQKIEMHYLEMMVHKWQSENATRRAEMQLGRLGP